MAQGRRYCRGEEHLRENRSGTEGSDHFGRERRNQFFQSIGIGRGHWFKDSGKVFPLCYGRNGRPRNCVACPNITHPSFTLRFPYTPSPELPLTSPAKEPFSPPPRKTSAPKPSGESESIARNVNQSKSFGCRPQTNHPVSASLKRQPTASERFHANADETARPSDPSPSPSIWKPSSKP